MRQGPAGWRQGSVAARRPCPLATLPSLEDHKALDSNKVSNRYFWNACKALSFGLLLMIIGTTMATIGYYADQLSKPPLTHSNMTVPVRSKGFQLHNLSYAGPIVMGVGGFIMVAACVMTFEARDSAAKVVPTRLKYASAALAAQRHSGGAGGGGGTKLSPAGASGRLHSSVRTDSRRSTAKWDQVYRVVGGSPSAGDRRALTQAFIQFSRELQRNSPGGAAAIAKSPSAPNLADKSPPPSAFQQSYVSLQPRGRRRSRSPSGGRPALLSPHALLQRQAVSMDSPDTYFSPPGSRRLAGDGGGSAESVDAEPCATGRPLNGSQTSMNIDLHLPNDCPVTLRIKDRTRRSDTAKRRALVRQTPIADDDDGPGRRETHSCSPRLSGYRRRGHDDRARPYSASTPHSRRDSLCGAPTPPPPPGAARGGMRRCNSSDSRRVGDVCLRSASYEKQAPLEGRLLFQIRRSDDELSRKSEFNESVIAENN